MLAGTKRKTTTPEEEDGRDAKKAKLVTNNPATPVPSSSQGTVHRDGEHRQVDVPESKKKEKRRPTEKEQVDGSSVPKASYRKLAPPRPFPTVPTSVSATGPRSAHVEGKNYICITRKTPLGSYLRRCKDIILKDGHKTLHLSAMGAAIPHLMQLTVSLPDILPYASDEIRTEIITGTVEVQDEVIPEDEDEDISYRTRGKSTVSVTITIGDGVDEGSRTGAGRKIASKRRAHNVGRNFGARGGRKSQHKQTRDGTTEEGPVIVRAEDLEEG